MKICAADTLKFFIEVILDVPFTENDIVFEYAKKNDMAKKALELCAVHCPEKVFTDTQLQQLNESIAANALIGREKSVVLIRLNSKQSKKDFKRMIFHELVHIFCGKVEMDGEHFIDIYGTGVTPDIAPENQIYDGLLSAGYTVWEEFIAHYYAIKMIDKEIFAFSRIADGVFHSLPHINALNFEGSKGDFSFMCSYWFNCNDLEKSLGKLNEPDTFFLSDKQYGTETQNALRVCMNYIYKQMQKEKPWKIDEDFIYELGTKFSFFRNYNTLYLGLIKAP
jgi:hypothetical protein